MNIELVKQIATDLVASKADWQMIRYIDAGASGAVFEINHPTHGPVALKVYDPRFFEGDDALIEVKRVALQNELREHGNPNLVEIYETAEFASTHYLLMELCPWKSMEKVISTLPNERVQDLLRQLVNAVSFLDQRGLVHRDIKPANIAVSDDFSTLKLLDLGVMRKISPAEGIGTDINEKKRFVATAQYSPPEYLAREEALGEEGFEALNVYQIGAVLHDMIMKRPIFQEEAESLNRYILYRAVTTKRPLVFNPQLPARLVSLCRAALEKDAVRRLAGVKLSDLLQEIDSAEAVRRRLGAQILRDQTPQAGPSVMVWETRVKNWISRAARAESSVLGRFLLSRARRGVGEVSWTLSFTDLNRSLALQLKRADDGAYLMLALPPQGDGEGTPLLEIYEEGPAIDQTLVVDQLREQILFALDSASPQIDEGERDE